jgi:7-cyano-7-deazaguanine synthase in queuosine biosynthesis
MRRGVPMELDSLSPLLQKRHPSIMAVLSQWLPEKPPATAVTWKRDTDPVPPATGVGCFFSGGADSFFSLEMHKDEITHIVFALGWDLQESQTQVWTRVKAMLEDVSSSYNKELIILRTNHRAVLPGWGITHGAALAAASHVLSETLGRMIIPSSYTREQLHPWGTHPELDHLWSSERVTIEHDSVAFTRVAKVARIAASEVAMRWLRVCWRNTEQQYNCGHCAKCIRTRIALTCVGAECQTFESQITADEVAAKYKPTDFVERYFAEELLEASTGSMHDALLTALKRRKPAS